MVAGNIAFSYQNKQNIQDTVQETPDLGAGQLINLQPGTYPAKYTTTTMRSTRIATEPAVFVFPY